VPNSASAKATFKITKSYTAKAATSDNGKGTNVKEVVRWTTTVPTATTTLITRTTLTLRFITTAPTAANVTAVLAGTVAPVIVPTPTMQQAGGQTASRRHQQILHEDEELMVLL
jgi:hypothetical protein